MTRPACVEDAFHELLGTFEPSSRDLLAARALQHRIDRKYLLPAGIAGPLLARLQAGHRIVRAGEAMLARYEDLYFDSPDLRFYDDHRRGRRPRYKVRIRRHVDRQRSFLEIKCKGRNDRTTKTRLELPFTQSALDADGERFVESHAPVDAARLVPCAAVVFHRATLVSVAAEERLTFDWRVEFHCGRRLHPLSHVQGAHCGRMRDELAGDTGGLAAGGALTGVVIAEIKQARWRNAGDAVDAFRAFRLRERSVSKYCLATSRLEAVRANRFRPVFRDVERLATWDNS